MPTIRIDTELKESEQAKGLPPFIRLPQGLVMIEIQGTVNRPLTLPDNYSFEQDPSGSFTMYSEEGKEKPAVKIGKLKFDTSDINNSKVELLVGKNQKLIGTMKKLEKPLGILKFPEMNNTAKSTDREYLKSQYVKFVDIIRYKLIFSNRPVPLMDD